MKMKLTKLDVLTAFLTVGSMLPGIVVYNKLPDRVAVHFNLNGQADGWAEKATAVFAMPLLLTALHLICCMVTSTDERAKNSPKSNAIVRMAVPSVAYLAETALVLYALDKLHDVITLMISFWGVMMIIIGNYMPKTRQNRFIGIKTHKTLTDDTVWNRTHRLAGFVWTIGGLVILVLGMLGLHTPAFILMMLIGLIPIIYSYFI